MSLGGFWLLSERFASTPNTVFKPTLNVRPNDLTKKKTNLIFKEYVLQLIHHGQPYVIENPFLSFGLEQNKLAQSWIRMVTIC